jgi:hypothetical protein
MHLETIDTLPEHFRRDDMDLIQQQEAPFPGPQELHDLFGIVRPFAGMRNHRVGGDDDSCGAGELVVSAVLLRKSVVRISLRLPYHPA